jgi:hypothetical protein
MPITDSAKAGGLVTAIGPQSLPNQTAARSLHMKITFFILYRIDPPAK